MHDSDSLTAALFERVWSTCGNKHQAQRVEFPNTVYAVGKTRKRFTKRLLNMSPISLEMQHIPFDNAVWYLALRCIVTPFTFALIDRAPVYLENSGRCMHALSSYVREC